MEENLFETSKRPWGATSSSITIIIYVDLERHSTNPDSQPDQINACTVHSVVGLVRESKR